MLHLIYFFLLINFSIFFAKLKTLLDTERYKFMVYRFIKFDDEMTLLTFKWREIWNLLNSFHLGGTDIERRLRMFTVHGVLKSVQVSKEYEQLIDPVKRRQYDESKQTPSAWLTHKDRESVWLYAVHYLRSSKWLNGVEPRLLAGIPNVQCSKCKYASVTHNL